MRPEDRGREEVERLESATEEEKEDDETRRQTAPQIRGFIINVYYLLKSSFLSSGGRVKSVEMKMIDTPGRMRLRSS